jgi:hypothetical protein
MADPRPPINFDEFIERKRTEGSLPITVGDKTFHLKPQETFTDDELRRFNATDDPFEIAEIICDDLPGFLEAGGTVAGLQGLIEEMAMKKLEEQGVGLGEVLRSLSS